MVASMTVLAGLAGSYWTVPVTLVKAPRTVEMPRWRTENWAAVWLGSMFQVWTWAVAVVASRVTVSKASNGGLFCIVSLQGSRMSATRDWRKAI